MSVSKSNTEKKILVLGATGKTGSRVLQRLTQLSWPVQSGSRSANPRFDWMDAGAHFNVIWLYPAPLKQSVDLLKQQ